MPNMTALPPDLLWQEHSQSLIVSQGDVVALLPKSGIQEYRYQTDKDEMLIGMSESRGNIYACYCTRLRHTIVRELTDSGMVGLFTVEGIHKLVAADEKLYLHSRNGIQAFNRGGNLLFRHTDPVLGTPSAINGILTFTSCTPQGQTVVHAMGSSNGEQRWKATLPEISDLLQAAAQTHHACYIADLQGVSSLNMKTGDFCWKKEMAIAAHGFCVVFNERVYFSYSCLDLSQTPFLGVQATKPGVRQKRTAQLAALNSDGDILWQQRLGEDAATFVTAPAVSSTENTVVVGASNGFMYAFSAKNGNKLWRSTLSSTSRIDSADGCLLSTPLLKGGLVYIGANDGFVHALSIRNGDILWSTFVEGAAMPFTFSTTTNSQQPYA
jgi:outer membrane protein assembly factor BamB